MTRRERILRALEGGLPDRPPISFDSHGNAMFKVFKYYGANDKNDLYHKAGIDGFSVWDWNAVMGKPKEAPIKTCEGYILDIWGNDNDVQQYCGLSNCSEVSMLHDHKWPRAEDFDFSHVYEQALSIKQKDMVVSAGHIWGGYQVHQNTRGMMNAMMDLMDEKYMATYLQYQSEFVCNYLKSLLSAGKGEIEVVRADDDVGNMDRMMISPQMWRTYYKPVWKKYFDIVHKHGAKVWFHSCGCVMPIMDDLIEIGADIWNPFPDYVSGNDHEQLKDYRKHRLVLDGGVSHLTLVHKSPNEVRKETREVLNRFAPDGGLLIGPSQVFTEDIPVENIIAFFDTVLA